ncbi:Uncharacterised protein [Mycobacterium tuberculosis]|nr:Uncharacterised protein [Mycobacterium tuberculosis]
MAPGPAVPKHTPNRPLVRAYPTAMSAAAASCRVLTTSISLRRLAACTNEFTDSAGMPNRYSTPRLIK